jgi:hypothetical protein
VGAIWRLLVRWVALTSGIGSLAFTVFMLYQSATGRPVPPNQALVTLGWMALVMFILSGGAAWQLERNKVADLEAKLRQARDKRNPELELLRPPFQEAIAKLGTRHKLALRYVLNHADRDATQLWQYLRDHGELFEQYEANRLLSEMEGWGLLIMTRQGNVYPHYAVTPLWRPLVVEWAAGRQ